MKKIVSLLLLLTIINTTCFNVCANSNTEIQKEITRLKNFGVYDYTITNYSSAEVFQESFYGGKLNKKTGIFTIKYRKKILGGTEKTTLYRLRIVKVKYKALKNKKEKFIYKKIKYKKIGRIKKPKIVRFKLVYNKNEIDGTSGFIIKKGKYFETDTKKKSKGKYRIIYSIDVQAKTNKEWH